jgi:hypothetical protein
MSWDQWCWLLGMGWVIALGGFLMHQAESRPDGVAARMWDALDHGLFGGRP